VLPYHRAGLAKYDRLQRPYRLPETQPPAADQQTHVVRLLEDCGLIVRPGGSS
jgi:pyruvate-formate lyase-activating enzyme